MAAASSSPTDPIVDGRLVRIALDQRFQVGTILQLGAASISVAVGIFQRPSLCLVVIAARLGVRQRVRGSNGGRALARSVGARASYAGAVGRRSPSFAAPC